MTLDEGIVEMAKGVGARLLPPETSLSRLIDRALAEFIERHADAKHPRPPKKGRK